MARFRLIPREEKFYDDFKAMADQLRQGARLLEEMLATDPPIADKADEIKEVEHKCDFLTHEIIQRLNRTFVTPIDREDIHALARSLDDVMDAIDDAAALVPLYRIDNVRPGARELTHVIVTQCRRDPRRASRRSSSARASSSAPSRSTASRTRPTASTSSPSASSSTKSATPITVMKWKEILDFLEEATDRCEDVANVLEGVVVKHG